MLMQHFRGRVVLPMSLGNGINPIHITYIVDMVEFVEIVLSNGDELFEYSHALLLGDLHFK